MTSDRFVCIIKRKLPGESKMKALSIFGHSPEPGAICDVTLDYASYFVPVVEFVPTMFDIQVEKKMCLFMNGCEFYSAAIFQYRLNTKC